MICIIIILIIYLIYLIGRNILIEALEIKKQKDHHPAVKTFKDYIYHKTHTDETLIYVKHR